MFHLFFEQSGTFKNELRKLGYRAYDYDIRNDFGETDKVIDLFSEIENAYRGGYSVFDNISAGDMIIAFFPCIRFEDQSIMNARCDNGSMKKWDEIRKLEYSMMWQEECVTLYRYISKLAIICLKRKIPLIIENPYSAQHYLTRYWCIKPKIIDRDRRINGDWYRKPTQYFFIGCEPKNNFLFEPIEYVDEKVITRVKNQVERSMIHKQYANRFLRQYVIEEESNYGF